MGSLSSDLPNLINLPGNPDGSFMWSAGGAARVDFSANEAESFDISDFSHVDPQQAGRGKVFQLHGRQN